MCSVSEEVQKIGLLEKLIKVSENVNSSRPELLEAKDFLANNSISKNV